MARRPIDDEYFRLLHAYVTKPAEEHLAAIADLGRQLVLADVPPEDVVELHEGALQQLVRHSPGLTLSETARLISVPLMELFMAYGLAFRRRLAIRQQAEEALRESEETLRHIIDASPNCVFVKDANGRYVLVNRSVVELYSTTMENMVGKTDQELAGELGLSVEEAKGFSADDKQVIESAQIKFIPEEFYTLPDGNQRWFQTTKLPFRLRGGPGGVLGVAVDITERKEAEEHLRQQERLAAVGQLAGGIAHDFNNILTSILLFANVLRRKPHLPEDMAPALETIAEEARGAARLIRQILDFSRRSVMEVQRVDLRDIVAGMSEILRRTLPENILLHIELGTGEHEVTADPTRVQQVLMNLCVNARDAMPEGGDLHIGLSTVDVAEGDEPPLREMEAGEWVCLAVSDTGTGMPPEVVSHIFEPFFTTKAVGKGTGLGLAQVHGIVKQHDGHIDVETKEGQGATFRIYLPAFREEVNREKEAVQGDANVNAPSGRGETILVVEDDERIRTALREVLTFYGYRVLTTENGQEALAVQASTANVDLVLTDLVMPVMGGKQLLRELKKADPNLTVLVITGHPLEESKQALKREGFLDVIRKPFEITLLAETIHRALHGSS